MSIRRSIAAVLGAAVLFAAADLAEAQTIAYAVPGTTNLRGDPSTNYPPIGSVYGGTQVYVEYREYGWCLVTVNGRRGYMAQSRLSFAQGPIIVAPQPRYVPVPQPRYVPVPQPYFGFGFGFGGGYDSDHRHDRRDHDDRPPRDHDGGHGHGHGNNDEWNTDAPRRGNEEPYWKRMDERG